MAVPPTLSLPLKGGGDEIREACGSSNPLMARELNRVLNFHLNFSPSPSKGEGRGGGDTTRGSSAGLGR
jgi:hypothetical protein